MNTVRRIASEIFGVGKSKVRFREDSVAKIGEALTREDVRALISDGAVYYLAPRNVSRAVARHKHLQKKKGRRFGAGSRKGTFAARSDPKETWIAKVRSQRRHLRTLSEQKKLSEGAYRKAYLMVKGNAFRGVRMLETYLRENQMMKKEK